MIFWTGSDESIFNFMEHNKPLISLSNQYELYIAHTGKKGGRLRRLYPNANIIECDSNVRPLKGAQIISLLKSTQFDIVVRLCPDAVVMDLNRLIAMTQHVAGMRALIGNVVVKKKSNKPTRTWVRGACNATTKEVIDAIKMKVGPKAKSFDQPFSDAVVRAGAKLIDRPLFEIGDVYSGKFPVWHPVQRSIGARFESFKLHAGR